MEEVRFTAGIAWITTDRLFCLVVEVAFPFTGPVTATHGGSSPAKTEITTWGLSKANLFTTTLLTVKLPLYHSTIRLSKFTSFTCSTEIDTRPIFTGNNVTTRVNLRDYLYKNFFFSNLIINFYWLSKKSSEYDNDVIRDYPHCMLSEFDSIIRRRNMKSKLLFSQWPSWNIYMYNSNRKW